MTVLEIAPMLDDQGEPLPILPGRDGLPRVYRADQQAPICCCVDVYNAVAMLGLVTDHSTKLWLITDDVGGLWALVRNRRIAWAYESYGRFTPSIRGPRSGRDIGGWEVVPQYEVVREVRGATQ